MCLRQSRDVMAFESSAGGPIEEGNSSRELAEQSRPQKMIKRACCKPQELPPCDPPLAITLLVTAPMPSVEDKGGYSMQ